MEVLKGLLKITTSTISTSLNSVKDCCFWSCICTLTMFTLPSLTEVCPLQRNRFTLTTTKQCSMIQTVSIAFVTYLCSFFFFSSPPSSGSLTVTGNSDGVSVCVLLFVMKIGFQQMDGEILKEKYNLKESVHGKNGLLWLLASSLPDWGKGAIAALIILLCWVHTHVVSEI